MLLSTRQHVQQIFHEYSSPWRVHLRKVITVLVAVGLTAAFVADLIKAQQLAATATLDSGYTLYAEDFTFPTSWKIATTLGLAAILTSGFIALFVEDLRKVGRLPLVAFFLMQGWMMIHAVVAFVDGMSPFEIISFKGPAVWWSCVIIFVGLDRERWKIISPLIYTFAFVASMFALNAIFSNQFSTRIESLRALFGYMPIMLWASPWLLVAFFQQSRFKMIFGIIPYLIFLLCSFLVVTRSWLVLSLLIPVALLFIAKRSSDKNVLNLRFLIVPVVLMMLFAVIGWYYFESQLTTAFDLLQERLLHDTRTGQYEQFFSQVTIPELLVGKGPKGTWIWAGKEYTSIDGSYILMLFNGGLPLLWAYIILMIRPAVQVLKTRAPPAEMLAAAILGIWGIALTGVSIYSTPDITVSHNILCLYAGRCLAYRQERLTARVSEG